MKKILLYYTLVIGLLLNDKILNNVWYGHYKTDWRYKENKFKQN